MSQFLTYLAVEDAPSLALVRKVLNNTGRFCIVTEFPMSGFGYLKTKMREFNKLASKNVVVVVTDIDNNAIDPSVFKQDWLNIPQNHGLIFELAIVEIESWIIADKSSFANYFSTSVHQIEETDELTDPKRTLNELARSSRSRNIREAMVPSEGAKIGPEYNITLIDFINNYWDETSARSNSESLEKFLTIIETFEDSSNLLLTTN